MADAFQQDIEDRTNLAGSNKFELLLFRLGRSADGIRDELFGINVFKIREIVPVLRIIKSIGTEPPLLGMINLRGNIIPVIDLPAVLGCRPTGPLNILLITEYARSVQAFAVAAVEEIVRLDWSSVMSAEEEVGGGMVTSIARIDSTDADTDDASRLVQVLDVEQILTTHLSRPLALEASSGDSLRHLLRPGAVVLAADDSKVARALIEHGLKALDLPYQMVKTGKEAWLTLQAMAQQAQAEGVDIHDKVGLLLTDIEMPEMDGFTLTRKVKADARLGTLPVLIHSSLSGSTNEEHVRNAGADGYVVKFATDALAEAVSAVLTPATAWKEARQKRA